MNHLKSKKLMNMNHGMHVFLAGFILLNFGCEDNCRDEQLQEFMTSQSGCSGATVTKYSFNGREVYAYAEGNCIADGSIVITDKDCNEICFLGGIAGLQECEGQLFFQNARLIEVLYEEP